MTTTAALEKGQVITVSAIVQGYESKDGRERVLLDIPDFHSQHDTKVDVTPEQKLAMPTGVAVNLTLKRENCASEKYRDRPYGWYYGLESIGSASAGPEAAPAPHDAAYEAEVREADARAVAAARKNAALAPDPRGNSIERQVALKAAVDLASNGVLVPAEGKNWLETIEAAADSFIAWLQGPDTGAGHLVQAARDMGAIDAKPDATDTEHGAMEPSDLPFDPSTEP